MAETIACLETDVPTGAAHRVVLPRADGAPAPYAIVRASDGSICALDDTCSHGQVSLSEGEVVGNEIECWGHGGRFDVRSGEPSALPAVVPVHVYPVRIEGGNVLVDVDSPITIKEDA